MESTSVYMCFPCYREFPTLEEVLAHQVNCNAESPQLVNNETPVETAAAAAGLPQVAMQSVPQIQTQTVDLSALLGQKKTAQTDAPRVLYQCADCEVLFDALSLWQQHRKTGCYHETGPGPGEGRGTVAVSEHQETVQEQPAGEQTVVKEQKEHPKVKMESISPQHEPIEEDSEREVEPEISNQGLPKNTELMEPVETPEPQGNTSPGEQSPPSRRRRQKKEKPPSTLLCVECGQSFGQVSELVTHRRVQHSLKDAIHRCTVCGEGFINTTLFLYHRRQHRTGMENQPVQVQSTVPQLSTAIMEAPGEGLLLLATAGEGQSLMEVTTLEQTVNETPVAHMEVELDSVDRGQEVHQPPMESTEREEISEVLVDKIVEMVEEGAGVNEVEGVEVVTVRITEKHSGEVEKENRVESEKAVFEENQRKVQSNTTEEPVPASSTGTEEQKFLCNQCGASFTNEKELATHRSNEHGLMAALHTCTECGAEFMSTTQFLYHRREHRMNPLAGQRLSAEGNCRLYTTSAVGTIAKCSESILRQPAGAAIEAPAQLSRDWSRTAVPHECPHCGKGFTRRSLLREHVFQHTGKKLFSCKFCTKSFPSPSSLLRHNLTHGASRLHNCHVCDKRFFQATSLKRHVLVHQFGAQDQRVRSRKKGRLSLSGGLLHTCPECPASFKSESQLLSHRLLHTSHPFPCKACGEAFKRRKELDLHYLIHEDKEPKTCPNCSAQFLNQTVLETHLQRCTGEAVVRRRYKGQGRGKVGGQLECDMCGHRCVTQDGLDLHRLSHTGQTPLRCPLTPCRRRFASSSALGEHLVAHCRGALGKKSVPRRFTCEFCGKEFAYASTFSVHLRTHTNERPFECTHCGKRFRQLPHLQDHERIHSGERPFSCWVCGKSFSVAARLTEHARVHSGERPYVCPRCPTAFRSRPNLDKHMRLHANDPVDPNAPNALDDDTAVQTILLVQESASSSPPSSSSGLPVVQEGMLVSEEGGSSVVFLHPNISVPGFSVPSLTASNISVVTGQDVPHTIEVILEETV
ncbi:zinc finger protein 574 [Misgurnus anguillicaudatus]|uniref:zinc finger protein 574 n=1 Tax=Misgurnus anguillicaudatus TaxID=75329 RepID=UPI003CCF2C20